jgi:rod shape-determining protein MreD
MVRGLSVLALLRAVAVLLAALLAVTLGSRLPFPTPDPVLPVVVAGALLAGPSRGALLGLGAGWLVDLMPPGATVLGASALMYAVAGLVAGAGRREGEAPLAWIAAVTGASALALEAGRVVSAMLAAGPVAWAEIGTRLLLTILLGMLAVPLLVRAEHALVRRRLA